MEFEFGDLQLNLHWGCEKSSNSGIKVRLKKEANPKPSEENTMLNLKSLALLALGAAPTQPQSGCQYLEPNAGRHSHSHLLRR